MDLVIFISLGVIFTIIITYCFINYEVIFGNSRLRIKKIRQGDDYTYIPQYWAWIHGWQNFKTVDDKLNVSIASFKYIRAAEDFIRSKSHSTSYDYY